MRRHHVRYKIPFPGWPNHFRETTSFNAALASICSAKSFFSLAFSRLKLAQPLRVLNLHAAEL